MHWLVAVSVIGLRSRAVDDRSHFIQPYYRSALSGQEHRAFALACLAGCDCLALNNPAAHLRPEPGKPIGSGGNGLLYTCLLIAYRRQR